MKKVVAISLLIILGTVSQNWAQTNAFRVTLTGTITRDTDKIQITNASLLTSASNILACVVDRTGNTIDLVEVNPATTNVENFIMGSWGVAVLATGKFNADLEAYDDPYEGVTNFPAGTPVFNGDLQADGTISLVSNSGIKAKLTGHWKDPTFNPTNQRAAVFKGQLKSTGTFPVPRNF